MADDLNSNFEHSAATFTYLFDSSRGHTLPLSAPPPVHREELIILNMRQDGIWWRGGDKKGQPRKQMKGIEKQMQISGGGKSLLRPAKRVQREPKKMSPRPFTIQATAVACLVTKTPQFWEKRPALHVCNASLVPRKEAAPERTKTTAADNSMTSKGVRGKKERRTERES